MRRAAKLYDFDDACRVLRYLNLSSYEALVIVGRSFDDRLTACDAMALEELLPAKPKGLARARDPNG